MKKLFFIALILISFQGIGQVYQYLPQYGYQMNRIQADSVLKIPSDTIRNKSGIARIGTTIYAGNGTYWTAVSGGSSYWQSSTTNNIDNTNSGNVGIGNTNPQYKLDVTGTINSTGNISTSQTVSANGGLEVVESFVPKVTLKNQSGYGGYMNLRNTGNQQKVNISSYEDNYINQPLAVGNNSVDASAQLDITASSKGLLIPRLTTTQRNNITTPATGLLIWNTTDSTLQQYRGLSGWSAIGGGGSSYTATLPLSISGTVISMPKASATDSGWVSNGSQIFSGDKTFTSSIGAGGTYSTELNDSYIILKRTIDSTTNANGHGFADLTIFKKNINGLSNNSFSDGGFIYGNKNYNHHSSFQSLFNYSSTGTMDNYFGFTDIPRLWSGTITNRYANYVFDFLSLGGAVTNQYGLYIPTLTNATNNYGIYVQKNRNYFGGGTLLNKDSVARQTSTKWKLAIDTTTGLIVRDSTGGGSTYSAGYGLSLATTTFSADSLQLSTKAWRQKGLDSLGAITALKSTTLSNGWGLLGGGDLSANRTYTADTVNLSTKANGTKQKDSVVSLLSSYLPLAGATYTTTSGNGLALTSSTVTSGNLVSLTNTGTAAASNTKTVLNIASSGANGTASQTTYGLQVANTNTGSGTNVGGTFSASGGTNNYGLLVPNGRVGIGLSAPAYPLDLTISASGGWGANIANGNSNVTLAHSSGFGIAVSTGSSSTSLYGLQVSSTGGIDFKVYNGGQVYAKTSLGVGIDPPTSRLQTSGSFATGYVAKTANYTATISDYTIDCTSGTFTVTLPTASSIAGRIYVIKNSGTGSITVDANASETIDGALTYTLGTQYKYVSIQSTGSAWIITANN